MVIISFGLLGMAGLQSRMQVADMEAYQRAQALVLLNDIAGRMTTNRNGTVTDAYLTPSAIDPTTDCAMLYPGPTAAQTDLKAWCRALQGSAETSGVNKSGAMVGGRGCVESLGNREYMITVAWQGLVPLSAPPSSVTCGQNSYDATPNSQCVNDLCRRVVTTVVRIAQLV
jgi:type IV pilus assembly protein PilV